MKYGVLLHPTTMNIGDDIQAYASSRFLPSIDYFLDREALDTFESEGNEPVAVIFSAWWMWKKWNWPPADVIYPKLVSMHLHPHTSNHDASSIRTEWLEGIGGEYFKAYGPVGCRDQHTVEVLQSKGIDSYFSGCITLTLPKMPERKREKEYICLVDVSSDIEKKVKELAKGQDIEFIKTTHSVDYRNSDATWEERVATVEELLTLYQNAKCVITSRVHCTFPCLAMEVPVLLVLDNRNSPRLSPYYDWINFATPDEFLSGSYEYDVLQPPENPKGYLKYRNELIESVEAFIEEAKKQDGLSAEELKKTSYTADEAHMWRYDLMKDALDKWLLEGRALRRKYMKECNSLKQKNKEKEKWIEKKYHNYEEFKKRPVVKSGLKLYWRCKKMFK